VHNKHHVKRLFRNGIFWGRNGWLDSRLTTQVLTVDGRIAGIGVEVDDQPVQPSEVIDLQGALVLPGLCDAHMHLAHGGRTFEMLDLSGLDYPKASNLLRQRREQINGGDWIIAFNWDRLHCTLNRGLLDKAVSDSPTIVYGRDLHSCCANSMALRIGGVDRSTASPDGGKIEKDGDGSITGILYETAVKLVANKIPVPSRSDWRKGILAGQEYLIKQGLTAVSEVLEAELEPVYRQLDEEGQLKLYVEGWRRVEHWDGISTPPSGSSRFSTRTLKLFLDGAFSSRTAALLEPFEGTDNRGVLFYQDQELREILTLGIQYGWRFAIHALGDGALAQLGRVVPTLPLSKWGRDIRIEHAELLPAEPLPAGLLNRSVISVQPIHLIDDQKWLGGLIGKERCLRTFVWRSLVEQGVPVALGSDWPVASPDPLKNIHITINRADYGERAHPDYDFSEALSPDSAILACTDGFVTAISGETAPEPIQVSKSADFTVVTGVSADLRDWSQAKVVMTIIRGEVLSGGEAI